MSEPILVCRNLTVGFDDIVLCGNINFELKAGDYMCVIGPSGIGKSTLVSTIMGITKPVSGEVILNGIGVKDIGCMPQTYYPGTSTVLDTVISGSISSMRGFFVNRRLKTQAMEALEKVGCADAAKRRYADLSGGMRQRVLLARALCGDKKLLLLDDPLRGLDIYAKDELYMQVLNLNREGVAVILIDPDALDGTILHLSDRRQLFCGSVLDYAESVPGRFYYNGVTI